MKYPLLTGLFSLIFSLSFAQVSFINSNSLLVDSDNHSGVAIAVADMNGDRLDDIVRLLDGVQICIEYQQNDGTFSREIFQVVGEDPQWSMAVGDVDNNGYNDIMCGGRYDDIKIYLADDLGQSYSEIILPGETMFAQASNLADINNDGYLDVFVCHDDAESRIWGNDTQGGFVQANDWIDMVTVPESDNSGNYGSVWTDFDQDGDLDLYIAKCRQGVSDPTDPRRINALFVNDGQGNFTEEAASRGLAIGRQSWTADFGDVDNDGDFDCFVTNHSAQSQILINDGTGNFTDQSDAAGIGFLDFALQGLLRDFDNDGWLDIIVSGGDQYYYHNNGDGTFTEVDNFIPNGHPAHTYSIGDLNHDGFLDINAGYGDIYTTPSSRDDVIWLNEANDHHWIALDLEGTTANRSATGAIARLYGPWGVQTKEVRIGESYGISNTHAVHFGIGSATSIDSILVYWPSGNTDKIESPSIDQFLLVKEKECVIGGLNIQANGPTVFCSGDSIIISAPEGLPQYLWNTGDTTSSIVVLESGGYRVTITQNDCSAASNIIQVVVDPDETPEILEGDFASLCPGEGFTLTSSVTEGNIWDSGEISQSIEVFEEGSYMVTIEGMCGPFTSAPFEVIELEVDPLEVENDTVQFGQFALIATNGTDPSWYDSQEDGILLGSGNTFSPGPMEETTVYYVEAFQEFAADLEYTGKQDNFGDGIFTNVGFRGLQITVEKEVFLESVKVYSEEAGNSTISVFDFNSSQVILQQPVTLIEGEQILELDMVLPESDRLVLFHDANDSSPRLFINTNSNDFDFPYTIPDILSITASTLDASTYDCFYDLAIRDLESKLCETDRFPVTVVVEGDVSVDELDADLFSLFPNPVESFLTLDINNGYSYQAGIFDFVGNEILRERTVQSGDQFDVKSLPAGLYYLRIKNDLGATHYQKWVKL
ncbi:MAG: T9SS type A sorting domain-containing protein [Saprospiraceae bacterium]|nr:T9SS type A sorting domain-containing protein [Saprospiraceae bacterium]